jgi:ribosomal protein L16 Arg81 hydroxylase
MRDLFSTPEKLEYFLCWWMEAAFGPRKGAVGRFGKQKDRLAKKFRERLTSQRSKWTLKSVPAYSSLSPDDFVESFARPGKPVLIRGAAKSWQAIGKWTPRYLAERFPDRCLPLVDPESQLRHRMATFAEVAEAIETNSRHTVKFSNFLHLHPEAEEDFDLSLIDRYKGVWHLGNTRQLFVAGQGTDTGMHAEMANVSFVQIQGRKRWLLLPEEWSPVINPQVDRQPYFLAQEDLVYPRDLEGDEVFSRLEFTEVILEPGDLFFNPAFNWHYVENLTATIGVGFRWTPLRSLYKSPLLSSIILSSQYPPPITTVLGNSRGQFFPRKWP